MKAEFDVGWLASAEADYYIEPCSLGEPSMSLRGAIVGLRNFYLLEKTLLPLGKFR